MQDKAQVNLPGLDVSRAKAGTAQPAVDRRARYNLVAVFPDAPNARRALNALIDAHVDAVTVSLQAAGYGADARQVRMGARDSDRTLGGLALGAIAGLFGGGIFVSLLGADSGPLEVLATVAFAATGGGILGGFIAATARPAPRDTAPDWRPPGTTLVRVESNELHRIYLAWQVLGTQNPLEIYSCTATGGASNRDFHAPRGNPYHGTVTGSRGTASARAARRPEPPHACRLPAACR